MFCLHKRAKKTTGSINLLILDLQDFPHNINFTLCQKIKCLYFSDKYFILLSYQLISCSTLFHFMALI